MLPADLGGYVDLYQRFPGIYATIIPGRRLERTKWTFKLFAKVGFFRRVGRMRPKARARFKSFKFAGWVLKWYCALMVLVHTIPY